MLQLHEDGLFQPWDSYGSLLERGNSQESSELGLHRSEILSIPAEQSPSPAVTGRFSMSSGIPSGGKGADTEMQQLPALGRAQLTPVLSSPSALVPDPGTSKAAQPNCQQLLQELNWGCWA